MKGVGPRNTTEERFSAVWGKKKSDHPNYKVSFCFEEKMPGAYYGRRAGENLTFFCTCKALRFYFNIVINISLPSTLPRVPFLSWKSVAFRIRRN